MKTFSYNVDCYLLFISQLTHYLSLPTIVITGKLYIQGQNCFLIEYCSPKSVCVNIVNVMTGSYWAMLGTSGEKHMFLQRNGIIE